MRKEDLVLVIEECAEVVQAATKILRFGVDDSHPRYYDGKPNSWVLTEEIGQLLHCIHRLQLDEKHVRDASARKGERLKTYGPDGTYLTRKRVERGEEICG